MPRAITDQTMKDQIITALGAYADEFDVDGLFEEIHKTHGLIDIGGLSQEEFWTIAERHDRTATA